MLASPVRIAHLLLLEREEALAPRHQLEHDFLDLEAHLPLELAPVRERAALHEQLAQLAVRLRRALRVARAREVGLRDLARRAAAARPSGCGLLRMAADTTAPRSK